MKKPSIALNLRKGVINFNGSVLFQHPFVCETLSAGLKWIDMYACYFVVTEALKEEALTLILTSYLPPFNPPLLGDIQLMIIMSHGWDSSLI